MTPRIEDIAAQPEADQAALLALNNRHARETSSLSPDQWRKLVGTAFAAWCVSGDAGFLIAFDQDALYDNPNFNWFRRRLARFVYVDRIVINSVYRGAGLARQIYSRLFETAVRVGIDEIVCEVNIDPPNPGSDAFHARMGFAEMGQAVLADRAKTVRYLRKSLDVASG